MLPPNAIVPRTVTGGERVKNLIDEAMKAGIKFDDYLRALPSGHWAKQLGGVDVNTQSALKRGVRNVAKRVPGVSLEKAARFAASDGVKGALRIVPGLSVGMAALDAGDIILGDESAGNKVMDTAAMGIGGTIGGILGGGVLSVPAAAAGASTGKFVSDGLQYLFGDKKTPEQRRMEEALAMLQGGRY